MTPGSSARGRTCLHGAGIHDTAGANIMLVIIAVVHVADHDPGHGCMNKFMIAEINPYMGDHATFAQCVKEDQVPFLQLAAANPPAGLILLF